MLELSSFYVTAVVLLSNVDSKHVSEPHVIQLMSAMTHSWNNFHGKGLIAFQQKQKVCDARLHESAK